MKKTNQTVRNGAHLTLFSLDNQNDPDKKAKQTKRRRFFGTNKGRVMLFGGIAIAVLIFLVLFFVCILPLIQAAINPEVPKITPNTFKDSIDADTAKKDVPEEKTTGYLQQEADIATTYINDPFYSDEQIIFGSTSVSGGIVVYDKLFLFDFSTKKTTPLSSIKIKYDNALMPLLNKNYIVFLDSNQDGGGRIVGYDRNTEKTFLIKDYAFSMPKISMDGNIIAFMQQAGSSLDRLYLYNLETREAVAYKIFQDLPTSPSSVCLKNGLLTYAIPYKTEDGYVRSRLYTYNLNTGEENHSEPGKFISAPKTDGTNIAFLSSVSGAPTDLYIMDAENNTPTLISRDVLNFDMENGFIVYSKDNNVFLYTIDTKSHMQLNTEVSRGMLISLNQGTVLWYDVTGGFKENVNIVKYANLGEFYGKIND